MEKMVKIAELKAVVAFLLRDRNLGVAGFRAELLQRLVEQVSSEKVDLPEAV